MWQIAESVSSVSMSRLYFAAGLEASFAASRERGGFGLERFPGKRRLSPREPRVPR